MLCEVIAYILSRQRLSAKTFVTGCVFYALQDRLSLWVLCDTAGVGGFPLHFSTGSPFGYHPRLRMVCPPLGTVGADWEVSFFSPSPLLHFSTSPLLHGFALRASPAVKHSVSPLGTVGAGWEISLFSPSPLLHGFSLRASSAVTHGVSPAGDSWCGSHHKKSV